MKTDKAALAYYLEPLIEHPWVIGYMPPTICRKLEETGFLDPDTFRVTVKGRRLLVSEGYLESAYEKPMLRVVTAPEVQA